MGRLYGALFVLVLVFATSMSFLTFGAYSADWVWAAVGAGILLVFVALGGLLVPPSRRQIALRWQPSVSALLQCFGALCTTLFLTGALVSWIMGNRTLSSNNAYEVLGLLIFLGLLGVVSQGLPVMIVRFGRAHAQAVGEERAAGGHQLADGAEAPLAHA